MIALAAALFAAAFALRLAVQGTDLEVLLLCILPIAILVAEFGLRGGLVGAGAAALLLALYVATADSEVGAWRYASRVMVFALLAVLVAALAEALRRLTLAHGEIERESAARREAERQRAEIARLAAERQRLAEELIAAEDEARRRIAEDLHDGALQTLLAAKQDLIEASPGRAKVIRASEEVGDGIDSLRCAVSALHPLTVERAGLESGIRAVATEAETRGGFRCELQIDDQASGPHDRIVVSLARELLANAVKHSDANEVCVTVRRDPSWLWLEVTDDGRGIGAGEHLAASSNGHIGLASVDRRVRALGGRLEIAADPGAGTAVSVHLPTDTRPCVEPELDRTAWAPSI